MRYPESVPSPHIAAAEVVCVPQRGLAVLPPCSSASLDACGCPQTSPVASPQTLDHWKAHTQAPIETAAACNSHLHTTAYITHCPSSSTSEMTIGRCSIGYPGTSPSLSCFLKSSREILFTPFLITHNILVFHGGDIFTEAKTVGTLSTALKAPEISSDLFQNIYVRWGVDIVARRCFSSACQLLVYAATNASDWLVIS